MMGNLFVTNHQHWVFLLVIKSIQEAEHAWMILSGECILLSSVSSQQRFVVTDIKAPGASQLLGLGQTVL